MRRAFLAILFSLLAVVPVFAQKVDYDMPYPGILPDHPLYKVKLVRDRLLDFLIVEPVRKAEFYILQGDKRLMMGVMLLDKGKGELAEQTISKGEKYLLAAGELLVKVKVSGKDIPGHINERIDKSVAKHSEIIVELLAKTSGSVAEGLRGSLDLVKKTQETIGKLR